MTQTLPTQPELKAQAKRLRADLVKAGNPVNHAKALEMIAHQWGVRDWNTLCAKVQSAPPARWYPGQRVRGAYLGHAFRGVIKSASESSGGWWQVTVRFDDPVDVVASEAFSSLRRQVSARLTPEGRSAEKTSDGTAHMVLDPA